MTGPAAPPDARAGEAAQAEAIAFLADPATHGGHPVKRIDTHAAIVFLTGERAYKLKRAVRLSYLDFSTCERRRAVCEAEVRLNRRTAPELYLGVRAIGRTPGGTLAFDAGDPVDWVVEMRRFPSACLLDTVAATGPLDPAMLRELADTIARFHEGAPVVRGDGAARVRAVIAGNRDSVARLAPGLLDAARCARLHRRSLATAARLAGLLDRRARAGRVRHGHGDLHLANIYLHDGQPVPFDCLEFDPELATTDVLYDLAFLLMDLWRRGLHREASLVFNRYCDRTGETAGLAALPLFLSMRAMVRAHVEARVAERQGGAQDRAERLAKARAYLDHAERFLTDPAPALVAIGGVSGTGKSTLAGRLAPLVGAAPGARWLRTDVLRKQLAGVDPETHLPDSAYTPAAHEAVYAALQERVGATLATGWPVIVDAVFDFPETRARIEALAARPGVPFAGLWLQADRAALHARVGARHGDASDAGPEVVDRQLARDSGPLGRWSAIDAGGSPDETLRRARTALSGKLLITASGTTR